eukprot:COSAG02_NODE_875_length_16279_cov_199.143078_3_plen_1291_part_00
MSGAPSPEQLKELLEETNFTAKEIQGFFSFGPDDTIDEDLFITLCAANGMTAPGLVRRMWDLFDVDDDGLCSDMELVKALNPLLRGTLEDVAGMFFELYDVDGDDELSATEIIAVYSDLLRASTPRASTPGVDAQGSKDVEIESRDGLTASQRRNITMLVRDAKAESSSGTLDKEAFKKVVRESVKATDQTSSLLSGRNLFFLFVTSWSEVGTSFALPAMGALSARIQRRFDCGAAEIGQLTALYYGAAMIGPMIGGLFMDKVGPELVVIGANVLVTLGALCQAIADGSSMFWLLMIGRVLLGLGGEVTPFTSVEILGKLFPDYFGLMAGVRNLIQSLCGFLAFVLLPIWADYGSSPEPANFNATGAERVPYIDNEGTSFALWVTVWLGVASTVSNVIVKQAMEKGSGGAEEAADSANITEAFRGFAKATAPQPPGACNKWKFPPAFFLACVGIKAQYFAPFGFTAFSNKVYADKFGQTKAEASFLSGVISLVAGLLGPIMGPLSDKYGQRSLFLSAFTAFALLGFVLLAISGGDNAAHVWVASLLFALQYGFGDTVAYISIRLIVGTSRAGVGYGVYGILGNLMATLVPLVGGMIMEMDNSNDLICWYFAFLMLLGTACWMGVRWLEGPLSFLELPSSAIIETDDDHLQAACLAMIIDGPGGLNYAESVKLSDTTGHATGAAARELTAINPFITVKFGRFTKGDRVHRTLTVKGDAKNEWGLQPDFSRVDGQGVMVSRTPGDEEVCIVDIWHDSLLGTDMTRHIAAMSITVEQAKSCKGKWQDLTVFGAALDTDGDGKIDDNDDLAEGKLKIKMTYHEDLRKLELEFGTSTLPDIRDQHLCDALTFSDSNIIAVSLTCFVWYLIISTIFYDMYFRECTDGPSSLSDSEGFLSVGNRSAAATVALTGDVLDARNTSELSIATENWGVDMANAGCENAGGLKSFLDALVRHISCVVRASRQTNTLLPAPRASACVCTARPGISIHYLHDGGIWNSPAELRRVRSGHGPLLLLRLHTPHDEHALNWCMFVLLLPGQILTVIYILSGMVIMGVLAGAVGQKLLVAVGSLTERVELIVLHGLECLQERMERGAESESQRIDDAAKKQYNPVRAVVSSFASMAVLLGIGTVAYMKLEKDVSAVKALYFTVVTVTTVGFGDIAPESSASKMFSVVFVPVGVIFFAKAMSAISDVPIRNRAAQLESYVLNQFLRQTTTYDLNALQRSVDLKEGEPIRKNDFCLAVLLRLGSVKREDLERIEAIFFALDRDRCVLRIFLIAHRCACSRTSLEREIHAT